MSDIPQLENRISAALDRIAWSIENAPAQAAPAPSPVVDDTAKEDLELERASNARLISENEKVSARLDRMEVRVQRLTERLEAADVENRRLENMVDVLSDNNAALRQANAAHQDGGDDVEAGLNAQLDHLKTLRAKDIAELDEIMAEMGPIVREA